MKSFFKKLWDIITVVRSSIANIIFLIFLLIVLMVIFAPGEPPLPKDAPLMVRISGVLVDELTHQPSILDLMDEDREDPETRLRDVTFAIRHAAGDKNVNGLVLNLNGLQGGSFSKLEEVGQAIDEFKQSGKPVIAFADSFSQRQYFLASYADTIYLNDFGNVALTGFAFYGAYFAEAAEKLSVKFHLFKVGEYKDAAEPYVRNSMSDASREHNSRWISNLWQRYTSTIETHRDLAPGSVENFIKSLYASEKNDFAVLAKDAGLIDELVSRVDLNKLLIERFGLSEDEQYFKAIPYERYLVQNLPKGLGLGDNIGLIVATGTIVDGSAPIGDIGGDSLSALIKQASEDESLKALIIRVDSGGGSAFASEVIRAQIAAARRDDLPIYLSMSSVAASGGYWIATAADEIWAHPATITGSIGVWGLIPNFAESLNRLGIHSDGFGTTSLSDIYDVSRPLSDQAKNVFQSGVEDIYSKFVNLVAGARGKSYDEIHAIAEGRVWTGENALELGLVDKLGSLHDLVSYIQEKHNLKGAEIKLIERPLTPTEQFIRAITEETQAFSLSVKRAMLGDEATALLEALPQASGIKDIDGKDGLSIYARCLACVAP